MSLATENASVVIVGAGPTGLMLATELCLCGVVPVVLERLPEISDIPKGNGMIGQIVPVLDYRGLATEFAADATYTGPIPGFDFGTLQVNFGPAASSPLHVMAIPQRQLERRLAGRLAALGGGIRRSHEVISLVPGDGEVTLAVRGPAGEYDLRSQYVVGCDGARSMVRKQAGIGFPGVTSTSLARMGRVRVPAEMIDPATGDLDVPGLGRLRLGRLVRAANGRYSMGRLAALDKNAPPDYYIVATHEETPGGEPDEPMTLAELRASFRRVLGADLPMSDPLWLTRTVGNSRLADRYQAGRVLLAGDAAHIIGAGGQLNTGMLDAVNLGWKLAAQVAGTAPDGLLDSYHAERHAAGQRALMQSRVQHALSEDDVYGAALRDLLGELLAYPEVTRHIGELLEGSDVRYDMHAARPHPLVGRLAPDIRLRTEGGTTRVAELLRSARPVLLDLTAEHRVVADSAAQWADWVTVVPAVPTATVPAPADGLLIRPDGYVAWAAGPGASDPAAGLAEALRTWVPRPAT